MNRRRALRCLALTYPVTVAMERQLKSTENARFDSEALRKLIPSLGTQSRDRLLRVLNDASLRGKLPVADVESILAAEHISVEVFMLDLLPIAQTYAHSPISHYRVGAVVRGTNGNLYLGSNIEVPGQMLGFAVHGEQCAVANAFTQGESGLASLAVTAAPCGHCRQFLNELRNSAEFRVIVKGSQPATLAKLLPESFGPGNLGVTERLFGGKSADLELTGGASDELASAALAAVGRSYSPYTNSPAGVAIASSGKGRAIYTGSYIECAAYNPSLSPLQAALAGMVMAGEAFENISEVALVELENAPISQMSATRAVLDAIAPAAKLRRVTARRNSE